MKNFNDEQMTALDLRSTPYTKEMLMAYARTKYNNTGKCSNRFLKDILNLLRDHNRIKDLFPNGLDLNVGSQKGIIKNYVSWMYEDAADLSNEFLMREWNYLNERNELEDLFVAEWVFSEQRWELGLELG